MQAATAHACCPAASLCAGGRSHCTCPLWSGLAHRVSGGSSTSPRSGKLQKSMLDFLVSVSHWGVCPSPFLALRRSELHWYTVLGVQSVTFHPVRCHVRPDLRQWGNARSRPWAHRMPPWGESQHVCAGPSCSHCFMCSASQHVGIYSSRATKTKGQAVLAVRLSE